MLLLWFRHGKLIVNVVLGLGFVERFETAETTFHHEKRLTAFPYSIHGTGRMFSVNLQATGHLCHNFVLDSLHQQTLNLLLLHRLTLHTSRQTCTVVQLRLKSFITLNYYNKQRDLIFLIDEKTICSCVVGIFIFHACIFLLLKLVHIYFYRI